MDDSTLKTRFAHHAPKSTAVSQAHEQARERGLDFARWINETLPDSSEKTKALDALDLTVMHANAGIARTQLGG